jgi:hypothetical protein
MPDGECRPIKLRVWNGMDEVHFRYSDYEFATRMHDTSHEPRIIYWATCTWDTIMEVYFQKL